VTRAPGRINLMGGHVDYNRGPVLPMAVPYYVYTALGRSEDPAADFFAADLGLNTRIDLRPLEPAPKGLHGWVDYVEGVIRELIRRGVNVSGCTGVIGGDLKREAGLGSSAALGISAGLALSQLFAPDRGTEELPLIARSAETDYAGVRCGIMDPFASFYCRKDRLLLLDCRSLEKRLVPLKLHGHRILICVTPVQRKLAASAYNERRSECENIVSRLGNKDIKIQSLRDLSPEKLAEARRLLPPSLFPRCRHVVTEMDRVRQSVRALKAGDLDRMGALMNASFESLRDDYQVTVPALDRFFETARRRSGIKGIRLTGAGFGGCVIMLVEEGHVDKNKKWATDFGRREFGQPIEVLPAFPVDGAEICR